MCPKFYCLFPPYPPLAPQMEESMKMISLLFHTVIQKCKMNHILQTHFLHSVALVQSSPRVLHRLHCVRQCFVDSAGGPGWSGCECWKDGAQGGTVPRGVPTRLHSIHLLRVQPYRVHPVRDHSLVTTCVPRRSGKVHSH